MKNKILLTLIVLLIMSLLSFFFVLYYENHNKESNNFSINSSDIMNYSNLSLEKMQQCEKDGECTILIRNCNCDLDSINIKYQKAWRNSTGCTGVFWKEFSCGSEYYTVPICLANKCILKAADQELINCLNNVSEEEGAIIRGGGNTIGGEILVNFIKNSTIKERKDTIEGFGLEADIYNFSDLVIVKVPDGYEGLWICRFRDIKIVKRGSFDREIHI